MRATILLAAATILLAGCDETPQATAPAPMPPPPVVAPAPAPATPPPTMAEIHHRHHHTAWREHSTSSEEYSESEVTDYDYVSDSHVTNVTATEDTHARHGYGLWLDGFGRAHDSDVHARRAGTMTRGRLKAWAHYDEGCDR